MFASKCNKYSWVNKENVYKYANKCLQVDVTNIYK